MNSSSSNKPEKPVVYETPFSLFHSRLDFPLRFKPTYLSEWKANIEAVAKAPLSIPYFDALAKVAPQDNQFEAINLVSYLRKRAFDTLDSVFDIDIELDEEITKPTTAESSLKLFIGGGIWNCIHLKHLDGKFRNSVTHEYSIQNGVIHFLDHKFYQDYVRHCGLMTHSLILLSDLLVDLFIYLHNPEALALFLNSVVPKLNASIDKLYTDQLDWIHSIGPQQSALQCAPRLAECLRKAREGALPILQHTLWEFVGQTVPCLKSSQQLFPDIFHFHDELVAKTEELKDWSAWDKHALAFALYRIHRALIIYTITVAEHKPANFWIPVTYYMQLPPPQSVAVLAPSQQFDEEDKQIKAKYRLFISQLEKLLLVIAATNPVLIFNSPSAKKAYNLSPAVRPLPCYLERQIINMETLRGGIALDTQPMKIKFHIEADFVTAALNIAAPIKTWKRSLVITRLFDHLIFDRVNDKNLRKRVCASLVLDTLINPIRVHVQRQTKLKTNPIYGSTLNSICARHIRCLRNRLDNLVLTRVEDSKESENHKKKQKKQLIAQIRVRILRFQDYTNPALLRE